MDGPTSRQLTTDREHEQRDTTAHGNVRSAGWLSGVRAVGKSGNDVVNKDGERAGAGRLKGDFQNPVQRDFCATSVVSTGLLIEKVPF